MIPPSDALVQVGDRVVSCFDIACGGCGSCKRGLFTSCDTTNPSEAMQAMYGDRSAGASQPVFSILK